MFSHSKILESTTISGQMNSVLVQRKIPCPISKVVHEHKLKVLDIVRIASTKRINVIPRSSIPNMLSKRRGNRIIHFFLSEPVAFRRVYGLESYSRTSGESNHHRQSVSDTRVPPRGRLLKSQLCIPKPDHLKMIFSKISTTQRDALIHKLVDHQQNQIRSSMHATDLSVSTDVHFHTPLSMRGQHGNLFCPEPVQSICNVHGVPSHFRQKQTGFCSRRRQNLAYLKPKISHRRT